MVDADTILFIGFLKELAEKSEGGFVPFSKASKEDVEKIIYDDSRVLYDDPDIPLHPKIYPLVLESIIGGEHQDVAASAKYWQGAHGLTGLVIACENQMDESYIAIQFDDKDWTIFIQDGEWWIEGED